MLGAALLLVIAPHTTLAQSSPGGGVDDANGVFQLDGNASKDSAICFLPAGGPDGGPLVSAPPCSGSATLVTFGAQTEDWSNIYAGSAVAVATSFVSDNFNSGTDNIYTGGGTKDNLDISGWLWKNGKPQGKDDIEHAYAAAYTRPSDGHTILVAGADRYDNSGDSTMGFWFVQDSTVGSGVTTCSAGGGCPFGGKHTDGDLLIISDFSQGGPVASIAVYKWQSGAAVLVNTIPGALIGECNPITGNKDLCGIVPDQNVSAPWGFTDKHLGATSSFEKGEFLEVGLDLNTIFATAPCFTTFFAETRSSTSITSTLSDFTTPVSFPLCAIGVKKLCNGPGTASGSTVSYTNALGSGWTVTVTNKGGSPLYNPTVTDTLPDGNVITIPVPSSCGATPNCLAGKASATVQVDFTVTCSSSGCTGAETGGGAVSNPKSVTNTADDYAYTQPNSGGIKITPKPDVPATDTCNANVNSGLTVTKYCDGTNGGPTLVAENGVVDVHVPFTATVCANTGAGAESISSITVSDDPASSDITIDKTSLDPGGCANVKGSYVPSAISSGNGLVAGRYFFSDTLTAKGLGSIDGAKVSGQGSQSCPICPYGECTLDSNLTNFNPKPAP
jgi:uncharacterized repeat protein (TIGR01451 family)